MGYNAVYIAKNLKTYLRNRQQAPEESKFINYQSSSCAVIYQTILTFQKGRYYSNI